MMNIKPYKELKKGRAGMPPS